MILLIFGSRDIDHTVATTCLEAELRDGAGITEVVSGKARGGDTIGEEWAKRHGIPVKEFPADWKKYGLSAGYIRNYTMGQYADEGVALYDGVSRGAAHMTHVLEAQGKRVRVIMVPKGNP